MSLFKKEPTRGASGESFTRRQLLEDLYLTKNALDTAYANFEAVVDPDLIDCKSICFACSSRNLYRFCTE